MRKAIRSDPHKRLRALLVDRRKAAGVTQQALSKKLGRPQSFVSKYESGERRLDVIEFIEVADAIGFDPAEFIREMWVK